MSMLRLDRGADQQGQTLVELAVVLPVFLLIIFGLFDIGRLVYTNATISQAAREGARVAAAEASWIAISAPACVPDESQITTSRPGAHVCPTDVNAFNSHIESAVNGMTVGLGPISDVYVSCNEDSLYDPTPDGAWTDETDGDGNRCADGLGNALGSTGDVVSVRVEYDYQTFTPLLQTFIGTVPLSASATMIIN